MKLMVDNDLPFRLAEALQCIFDEDEIISLRGKFEGRRNVKDLEWISVQFEASLGNFLAGILFLCLGQAEICNGAPRRGELTVFLAAEKAIDFDVEELGQFVCCIESDGLFARCELHE